MHFEVAERFVRRAADRMALAAPALAEEDERTAFLLIIHRVSVAPREPVDRRIGEDQRELEFGNGAREHREIDGAACRNRRKERAEELPVGRRSIETLQHHRTDGVVARSSGVVRGKASTLAVVELIERRTNGSGGTGESRDLDELGRGMCAWAIDR
jgi:hypothetical protein